MQRLPLLLIEANTISEAWIKTLRKVYKKGLYMPNHYEDKPSKEATVSVNIKYPLDEPKIHPGDAIALSCCKLDGGSYQKEILNGTLDHKVDEGNLSYTYHRRLFHWGKDVGKHTKYLIENDFPYLVLELDRGDISITPINSPDFPPNPTPIIEFTEGINQIEYLIKKAKQEPVSRKLQVTTWQPHKDLLISGAPCLQRIWFRIIEDKYLTMETCWRSRDLFKAWTSNCIGMIELGKLIANRLNLQLNQYIDFSNSLHIYASDFEAVESVFETINKRKPK